MNTEIQPKTPRKYIPVKVYLKQIAETLLIVNIVF